MALPVPPDDGCLWANNLLTTGWLVLAPTHFDGYNSSCGGIDGRAWWIQR